MTARSLEKKRRAASAKGDAAEVERLHGRLRHLYEIGKVLARFESVERTVPEVLALMSEVVPLRSAVLMLEDRTGLRSWTRAIVWHAEGASASRLRAAKAHAKTAYAYLTRTTSNVEEEAGATSLRASAPLPPESGSEGFVLLPLVIDQHRIFGALQVQGATKLDEADLTFVNATVNQLAIALDRIAVVAAKHAVAKAGQVAAELLAETSAALFSSLEYDKTLTAAVQAAVPALADLCFIDEVTEDGRIQRVDVVVGDASKPLADRIRQFPPAPDSRTPQAQVLRSGESTLLDSFENFAHDRASADLLKEIGAQSMMIVPLITRGRTLGALTFVMAESGRLYSGSDLVLAEEIGRRAAIAIDNARLYAKAQRAIQARQDLIAIVSHDLNNPLGVILISASILLNVLPAEPGMLKERVEGIQSAAYRMNRIIADLLDVASLEAGHLSVEKKRHPGAVIVVEAVKLHAAMAAQKRLRLESSLPDETFEVACDRDRILQVLGNLIGNATKFTPTGGTIHVRVEPRDGETLFSVTDTGPGIASDELPRVFDRYWQAKKTASLGTGLGLFISKGIVEAHGGRIWAESTQARGATFFFTIPIEADQVPANRKAGHALSG